MVLAFQILFSVSISSNSSILSGNFTALINTVEKGSFNHPISPKV